MEKYAGMERGERREGWNARLHWRGSRCKNRAAGNNSSARGKMMRLARRNGGTSPFKRLGVERTMSSRDGRDTKGRRVSIGTSENRYS